MHARFGVRLDQPCQCGPRVVMLGFQALQPTVPGRAPPLHICLLGRGQEEVRMALPGLRGLVTLPQLLKAILTNRLQHPEARLALGRGFLAQQVLSDEAL
jgi:hypothetical protein